MALFSSLGKKLPWLIALLGLLLLPGAAAALVAQGYQFSGTPLPGAIVSTDPHAAGDVVLASTNNISNLAGVIVSPSSVGVNLAATGVSALVVSSGNASVIVSDINGSLQKGDYVTASSIAGVGAKALESGRVIGTAEASFTGHEAGDSQITLGTGTAKRTVHIGQILVALDVQTALANGSSTYVPAAVQSLANTIAGRPVATWRLIAGAFILLVGLISVFVLLYSAVRNSIVAIGRNPLSRASVYRGLTQVTFIALIVLVACGGGVYAVVRL